jgi:hypothetical protein
VKSAGTILDAENGNIDAKPQNRCSAWISDCKGPEFGEGMKPVKRREKLLPPRI